LARDIARAIAVHERICHRFETEHGPARSEARQLPPEWRACA
jgi:hypothetical protein